MMKKRIWGAVSVLVCSLMLVTMFSSCDDSGTNKALVIKNDSDSTIQFIGIRFSEYVYGSRNYDLNKYNALLNEETIAQNESKAFYLPSHSVDNVIVEIKNVDEK